MRAPRRVLAGLLGTALVAAMLAAVPAVSAVAEDVPPTPSPSPTVPTPSTPAPELSADLAIDKSSSLAVNLAIGKVSIRFRSRVASKRPVSLQVSKDDAWVQVAKAKMNSKGQVVFYVGAYPVDSAYRAVALRYRVKKKLAPLVATRSSKWKVMDDAFNGTSLDNENWSHRPSGSSAGRLCSRTLSDMYDVRDGKFVANVDYEKDADLARRLHEAAEDDQLREYHAALDAANLLTGKARTEALKRADRIKRIGCVDGGNRAESQLGVFQSSMISTRGKLVINTAKPGMVAARVRFPEVQGMHGAVWLQGKAEIDLVEGFGYGRGISNYIHTASKKTLNAEGPRVAKLGAYVMPSWTKKRSYWAKYHNYSVSWDSKGFTFRVDGKISEKVKIKPGDVDYSLMVSLLVSDWEAYRITDPVKTKGFSDVPRATLPETMSVDWVRVWQTA